MFATFFLSVSQTFRRHPSNCHPVAVFTQEYSQSWGLTLASLHPCRVAMSICTKKNGVHILHDTMMLLCLSCVSLQIVGMHMSKGGGLCYCMQCSPKTDDEFWRFGDKLKYFNVLHIDSSCVFLALKECLKWGSNWTCQPHRKAFAAITKQHRWISC